MQVPCAAPSGAGGGGFADRRRKSRSLRRRPRLSAAQREALRAGVSKHERRNREFWDADADDYQAAHRDQLAHGMVWGVWSIPEAELGVLGDVRGLDVLEYGCGAAHWSVALVEAGARVVGLDLSWSQLGHATVNAATAAVALPLLCASGEGAPLRGRSFDVVFCDHGAMTFCDPYRTVPEVSRLLRPGGLLAFSQSTPIALVTDAGRGPSKRLSRDLFGLHQVTWPEGTAEFQLSHGEWIRLFRANDLVVEDLVELRAPEGATTSYTEYVTYEWARRWPAEQIWKVRKASGD
jgi:SAM-dependent methyltransferase